MSDQDWREAARRVADAARTMRTMLGAREAHNAALRGGVERIWRKRAMLRGEEGLADETEEDNYLGEMAGAASAYCWAAQQQISSAPVEVVTLHPHQSFRWPHYRWRPVKDPIDNLAIAGAYCAAEIDRLLREREES